MHVYWTSFTWSHWHFYIAATDQGVCYVGTPDAAFSELTDWVQRKFPDAVLLEDDKRLAETTPEIKMFLDGKTKDFSLRLHIIGTPFQRKVWKEMSEVAYGTTTTYSTIATNIGNPKAVRAVGTAIGANPLMIILPCHRVIAKNGSLTGFRGGLTMKALLLELEKRHA